MTDHKYLGKHRYFSPTDEEAIRRNVNDPTQCQALIEYVKTLLSTSMIVNDPEEECVREQMSIDLERYETRLEELQIQAYAKMESRITGT